MIISQIIWWIWNQMFQYAFGHYIAQQTNSELFLDINWLGRPTFDWYQKRNFALANLSIPNLKYIYTPFHKQNSTDRNLFDYWRFFANNKLGIYSHKYDIINQEWFEYKSEYTDQIKSKYTTNINNKNFINHWSYWSSTYLVWFRQSEKFRKPIANQIKNDFKIWYEIPQIAKDLIHKIKSTNSIAINVRRADFVQIGKIANIHDVCTTKYYQDAIDYIYQKYSDLWSTCEFFVFSDDLDRCRQNLNFPSPFTIVYPNIYKWFEYELYMYILWQCQNYIIPNSSFARWSVYLWRELEKTIIIPDKWFNNDLNTNDLIPAKRNAIKIKV